LQSHFNLLSSWRGDTVSDCFSAWHSDCSSPICLAVHVSWNLWIERNRTLFDDRSPSIQVVLFRVLASYNWKQPTVNSFLHKEIDLSLPEGFTIACFDGATLSSGACCGAGGFFKSHSSRITKWYLNCGSGSNTKAELMGLWTTLFLASTWSIKLLLVRGDSKVIIDWITLKSNLHTVQIECWKQRTLELAKNFTTLNVQHFP